MDKRTKLWKIFYSLTFKPRWRFINGGKNMAKCPKCGKEVANPSKTWKMAGRPDKSGKKVELTIGLFRCAACGPFRVVLKKEKK